MPYNNGTYKPKHYCAYIHFLTCLESVNPEPNDLSNRKFLSNAPVWISGDSRIKDVIDSNPLRASLRSFTQDWTLHPPSESFIFCYGLFYCEKEGNDTILRVKTFDISRVQGVEGDPQPRPAFVTVIGSAGAKQEPTNETKSVLRSFELKTSIYNELSRQNVEFAVQCFFPFDNYHKAIPTPDLDCLCSVTGTIIGLQEGSGNLAVLIQDIVYLSGRNSRPATNTSFAPATPTKSNRSKAIDWASQNQWSPTSG